MASEEKQFNANNLYSFAYSISNYELTEYSDDNSDLEYVTDWDSDWGSDLDPDEDINEALRMEPDSDSELGEILKPRKKRNHVKGVTVPYAEPQSVHTFMDDTTELTIWLVKKFPLKAFPYKRPFDHWLFDYCERVVDLVIDNKYRLIDILNAVLHYIRESPHKDDLYKILLTEANLNKDVCTSGYITFLVNVVRGFPGVPNFKGQEYEHRRQLVYHHLNKTLDFSDPESIARQITTQTEVILSLDCPTKDLLSILTKYTGATWFLDHKGVLKC